MSSAVACKYTASEIARRLNGRLDGPAELSLHGVNSLAEAGPTDITFITDQVFASRWAAARAGAAVVSEGIGVEGHDPAERALIRVPDAEMAMIDLLEMSAPPVPRPDVGVHATSLVHESASLGDDVRIGPHVSIDAGASIGSGSDIHAGVRIYANVTIGEHCVIHGNCVIRERCMLGRHVILHPNVSIGADGFGYRPRADGAGLRKVPQIGTVEIHDDVEIGAGTCIDRGKFGATIIGTGTKIDNLCHIAHNCRIGRSTVIAALSGFAGSVTVGDGVMIAGQAGVTDGLTIGDGARIGAQAGLLKDVDPGQTVWGSPADLISSRLRQVAALRKLPDYMQRISRLLKAAER